jgi:hypothetical protein
MRLQVLLCQPSGQQSAFTRLEPCHWVWLRAGVLPHKRQEGKPTHHLLQERKILVPAGQHTQPPSSNAPAYLAFKKQGARHQDFRHSITITVGTCSGSIWAAGKQAYM